MLSCDSLITVSCLSFSNHKLALLQQQEVREYWTRDSNLERASADQSTDSMSSTERWRDAPQPSAQPTQLPAPQQTATVTMPLPRWSDNEHISAASGEGTSKQPATRTNSPEHPLSGFTSGPHPAVADRRPQQSRIQSGGPALAYRPSLAPAPVPKQPSAGPLSSYADSRQGGMSQLPMYTYAGQQSAATAAPDHDTYGGQLTRQTDAGQLSDNAAATEVGVGQAAAAEEAGYYLTQLRQRQQEPVVEVYPADGGSPHRIPPPPLPPLPKALKKQLQQQSWWEMLRGQRGVFDPIV